VPAKCVQGHPAPLSAATHQEEARKARHRDYTKLHSHNCNPIKATLPSATPDPEPNQLVPGRSSLIRAIMNSGPVFGHEAPLIAALVKKSGRMVQRARNYSIVSGGRGPSSVRNGSTAGFRGATFETSRPSLKTPQFSALNRRCIYLELCTIASVALFKCSARRGPQSLMVHQKLRASLRPPPPPRAALQPDQPRDPDYQDRACAD
jgi:hypothetical protein